MTTELASTGRSFTLVVAALLCVSSAFVNAQGQNVVVISGATVMSGTGRSPIKNAVIVIVITGDKIAFCLINGGV
jgi:uncharacterized protein with FMN-binding domain